MEPVVEFEQVSKQYRLGAGEASLKSLLSGFGSRSARNGHDRFWALRDVSFQVAAGQAVGIIGPNGAGKTTTLKLLSRISRPTSGYILTRGRTSALIELGAGFHPELSGRENIFLNGIILGLSRREIARRFDEIVEFAEVGRFIDTPVKRYSSGMYARLGFAVAAHVEPDILLVDEVLSVGDIAFQAKCFARMRQLLRNGTALIFVSHNFTAVQEMCSRCLVLSQGHLAFDGRSAEAVAEYSAILRKAAASSAKPESRDAGGLAERRMTHGARISRVAFCGAAGPTTTVRSGERAWVEVEVEFFEDAPAPIFACTVRSEKGEPVYDTTTRLLKTPVPDFKAGQRSVINFALDVHLLSGTYSITVDLAYADLTCYYDYLANAITFTVTDEFGATGVANLDAQVNIRVL